MQYILYHASTESFTYFDENKIKADETDALYNGFWFSSKKHTSPSFRNPKYLKKCIVTLNNPAPIDIISKTIKELRDSDLEGYRSLPDTVRLNLKSLGYDGIIFNNIPEVNEEELNSKGKTHFFTARGYKYYLELDTKYGGVDLLDLYENFITGYEDLADFLNMQEITIIVFSNEQIEILEEIKL